MTALVVAPCSADAARFAVEHWHYSRRVPAPKAARFGAWEDSQFVGAVVFGWGANRNVFAEFDVTMYQCAELVRVALRHDHASPVSQVVSRAVSCLRDSSPGLRLLLSYADPHHGHHGGIYQALNWTYLGTSVESRPWQLPSGRIVHNRTLTGGAFGKDTRPLPFGARRVTMPAKHKYAWPLDRSMRRKLAAKARPYPRGRSLDGETSEAPSGSAGSTPADRSTIGPRVEA